MAGNLVVQSPDFDNIRNLKGYAIEDGIKLVWYALNALSAQQTTNIQTNKDTLSPLLKLDAPSSNQDNYNSEGATVICFTSAGGFNLTGIRNPVPGMIKFILNLGAGTVTVKHEVTSDAANRIDMAAGADKGVTTNKCMGLFYVNSRWREMVFA